MLEKEVVLFNDEHFYYDLEKKLVKILVFRYKFCIVLLLKVKTLEEAFKRVLFSS